MSHPNAPTYAQLIVQNPTSDSSDAADPPGRIHFRIATILLAVGIGYSLVLPFNSGEDHRAVTIDRVIQFLTRENGISPHVVHAVHFSMFFSLSFCSAAGLLIDRTRWGWRSVWAWFFVFSGCLSLSLFCEFLHSWLHSTAFDTEILTIQALSVAAGLAGWFLAGPALIAIGRAGGRVVTVWLTLLNLSAVAFVLVLVRGVDDEWWLSAAMTYLPRSPLLLPSLALLGCSLVWRRRYVWCNLLACGLVLGPIMELQLPDWNSAPHGDPETRLKVVSCNVQWFRPDFGQILEEITELDPDVVAFQDFGRIDDRFNSYFGDWHTAESGQFWVGSRYPVRFVGIISEQRRRTVAATFEIQAPQGPFLLHVVHLDSPRDALSELRPRSIFTGDGTDEVERFLAKQQEESRLLRDHVRDGHAGPPQLVMGDFNMPVSSSIFRSQWSDLQNAFDTAGFGYGYTFPCTTQRTWPTGVPFVRIDHILADANWSIEHCRVGTRNGSDHRLITATLSLRTAD